MKYRKSTSLWDIEILQNGVRTTNSLEKTHEDSVTEDVQNLVYCLTMHIVKKTLNRTTNKT